MIWFLFGDRFEDECCSQEFPFGVKFAHIHGGETTLGAIDNVYRHQILLVIFYFTAILKDKLTY
jgi:GDP/UDP-N,N'-diacetylbacillosamine 2-epimerase (hydrolysing)